MKSGWFWNTPMWEAYQQAYYAGRARPDEYKSSPLANDHVFDDERYVIETHRTQVIDLQKLEWSQVRKSYHSIIARANDRYRMNCAQASEYIAHCFKPVHRDAFGVVRNDETYAIQEQWVKNGCGLVVIAWEGYTEIDRVVAGAYWIIHQNSAYYASGPSIIQNVQHAVIWKSLQFLKIKGLRYVEMGQIDGETEKERNIGRFKQGFGGEVRPFQIARRK